MIVYVIKYLGRREGKTSELVKVVRKNSLWI